MVGGISKLLMSEPKTNRTLRVALTTASHSALLYSATDIFLLNALELDQFPYLEKLGPDVLSPSIVWRDISRQLLDKRFSGRSISASVSGSIVSSQGWETICARKYFSRLK